MRRKWVAAMCLACMLVLAARSGASGERVLDFPEEGFRMRLPESWVKIPERVFRERMRPLKKAYEKSGSEKRFDYDCAVQLESKEWFRYPYMLINLWEDTRVDSDEISEMNHRIEENLLQGDVGVNGTDLLSSSYDPKRHFYRAEVRFSISDKQMMLLKGVRYLNQSVLQLSAYMPEGMYSRYAPEIKRAMDSLEIDADRVHRASEDRWLELEDVVPYLKMVIATLIAFAVAGIYVVYRRRGTGS